MLSHAQPRCDLCGSCLPCRGLHTLYCKPQHADPPPQSDAECLGRGSETRSSDPEEGGGDRDQGEGAGAPPGRPQEGAVQRAKELKPTVVRSQISRFQFISRRSSS
ncbi:hypothetical protein SEVIR_1G121333v4 [Setaria viridis]